MRMKLFVVLIVFSSLLKAEDTMITSPGEWSFENTSTKYIECLNQNTDDEFRGCQLSSSGKIYQLFCPQLETVDVQLKKVDKQYYCYAQKLDCIDPIPCAVLEKVVHQTGIDLCKHAEIRNDRKCHDGYTYRIDFEQLADQNAKISDKCCRRIEIFSRPGVRL